MSGKSKIKEVQRELREQNDYLKALFDSIVDGIVLISKIGIIIKSNKGFALWAGVGGQELSGKHLSSVLKCKCSAPCLGKIEFSEICPFILENERLSPTEAYICNCRTKQERFLNVCSSYFIGADNEKHYILVLRDITDAKEIEKLREDFTATLTHDLRVPILASIHTLNLFFKGFFGSLTEKQEEALQKMLESNIGLLELVNTLLDVYKHEQAPFEPKKELISLDKLILECLNEVLPLAQKHGQTIINNALEKILASLDKSQIKRVITNLISNAITYTTEGGEITINCEIRNNEVITSISDNGKGISAKELDKIFDRYYSRALKYRKVGTGLGLYLSRKIIESHNGKIWAESILNKGSTFYFSLPL